MSRQTITGVLHVIRRRKRARGQGLTRQLGDVVLELARQLPGAEERVRPNGQRILVIELEPAPEPFLPPDLMDSPPKEDE